MKNKKPTKKELLEEDLYFGEEELPTNKNIVVDFYMKEKGGVKVILRDKTIAEINAAVAAVVPIFSFS